MCNLLEKAGQDFDVRTHMILPKTAIPCEFGPFDNCKEKAIKIMKNTQKAPKNTDFLRFFDKFKPALHAILGYVSLSPQA